MKGSAPRTPFWRAPIFDTDEQTSKARILHVVCCSIAIIVAIAMAIESILLPDRIVRWTVITGAVTLSCVGALALNRRGRTHLGALLAVGVLWLATTAAAWTAGGIVAPAVTAYIFIVLIAGLLLGYKAGIATGVLSAATGLLMVVLDAAGKLPITDYQYSTLSLWCLNVMFIAIIITVQRLAVRSLSSALHQARSELAERKEAEAALRKSEEKFSKAFRASPDGLAISELESGRYVEVNDGYCRLYGHTREQMLDRTSIELKIWEDPRDRDRIVAGLKSHGMVRDLELRTRTRTGELRIVRVSAESIDIAGQSCLVSVLHDITDRVHAEQASHASEQRFRVIFDSAYELIGLLSPDGILLEANQTALDIVGVRREEVIGKPFWETPWWSHSPELQKSLRAGIAQAAQGKVFRSEAEHPTVDGRMITVEFRIRPVFDKTGKVVMLIPEGHDITERRRVEQLTGTQIQVLERIAGGKPLTETLEMLLRMLESQSCDILCSIFLLDSDIQRLRLGAAPSLPVEYTKCIEDIPISPSAGSGGTAAFRREPVFVADIESDPLWSECKHFALAHGLRACWSTPILDAQQHVLGTLDLYRRKPGLPGSQDVQLIEMAAHTAAVCIAKHRADRALRYSEESLRATIENTPNVAVQWFDREGRVTFWNQASEVLFGWTAAEACGKTLDQLTLGATESAAFQQALKEIERTDEAVGPIEFTFRRRDGVFGSSLSTIFRIQLPSGEPRFVCMDVDLTKHKAAEESLRQAQTRELQAREEFARHLLTAQERERKRLAAELHDSLGQNLSIIKNRADFALQSSDLAAGISNHLEGIRRAAIEAIAETRNLAHNLRPPHIEQIGLTESLRALLLEVAQSGTIQFEERLENVDDIFQDEAATSVYRILQEALNNLVKHSQARRVNVTLERDVRSVRLRVHDDGIGFDAQQARSRGGLGLTSINERARMLGGSLELESTPGKGTELIVDLPFNIDDS